LKKARGAPCLLEASALFLLNLENRSACAVVFLMMAINSYGKSFPTQTCMVEIKSMKPSRADRIDSSSAAAAIRRVIFLSSLRSKRVNVDQGIVWGCQMTSFMVHDSNSFAAPSNTRRWLEMANPPTRS
jgi:hypothetical protein